MKCREDDIKMLIIWTFYRAVNNTILEIKRCILTDNIIRKCY